MATTMKSLVPRTELFQAQRDMKTLAQALEAQRKCFDGILADERQRATQARTDLEERSRELAQRVAALTALQSSLQKELDAARDQLVREAASHQAQLCRVTRAHLASLGALRRAYQKRLSEPRAAAA
jgi:hypothetical protein